MDFLLSIFEQTTCLFYRMTGIYCPGCGGTRAYYALRMGHPLISIRFNPIVLYSVICIVLFILHLCRYAFTGKKRIATQTLALSMLVGAAIILLLNYDVRLLLTLIFDMDPMP